MAWYDFIKDAGDKIFGKDKPEAAKVEKQIKRHQIGGKGIRVELKGDEAILSGTVESQEKLEKIILAAGNNAGVARVNSDAVIVEQPAKEADEAVFYTVKRGDYLSKIAKNQYGKASKYMLIFNANKPMLTHPDKIYPGQVLRIPPLK